MELFLRTKTKEKQKSNSVYQNNSSRFFTNKMAPEIYQVTDVNDTLG